MLACVESNFSNFKFEYLHENEFLRKTILACLSGAQMGLINEKNRVRKSRDTAPLTNPTWHISKIRPPQYLKALSQYIFLKGSPCHICKIKILDWTAWIIQST